MTYLFTKCVTESCDSPDLPIQYCLSSASSRVTETVSLKMPCGDFFDILGGFRKMNILLGMKILWMFFGGHHKIGLSLGVISMHFRVFY